jgi:hypothetical protein
MVWWCGSGNVRGIVLSFAILQILQYCITCMYWGTWNRRIRLLSVTEEQDRVVSLEYLSLEKLNNNFVPNCHLMPCFTSKLFQSLVRFLAMFKFQSQNSGLPNQLTRFTHSYIVTRACRWWSYSEMLTT